MKPCSALILLTLLLPAQAGEPAFHATDWKIAVDLQAVLRPVEMKAADWLRRFQPSDEAERQPIGFGAARITARRYGEETTFHATIVERGGKVAAVRIEVWTFSKAKLARLRTAWGKSVHAVRGGIAYSWTEPERIAALRTAIDRELGGVQTKEVPKKLRASWDLLLDPARTYHFGVSCYESGEAPPGCVAMDALVAAKRTDLVQAVLRSANPEARMHAALALLGSAKANGKALDDADAKAIAKLRKQRIRILCCDGCIVSRKKPGQALDELLDDGIDPPKPGRDNRTQR